MAVTREDLTQARQQRDQAQARFQITFDVNPAPSMIVRLSNAEVVVTNLGFQEVSGRGNQEVQGRSVRDLELFTDPEDFERILSCLEGGEAGIKQTLVMSSRTLGERTMLVSTNPIELNSDACGIFTFADVTEIKQSQELFSQTFRLIPVPATLTDAEARFTEVNEAFESLTGYTQSEVVGRTSGELRLWASRKDQTSITDALKTQREYQNLALNLRTKAGGILHVLGSAKSLTVADKQVLVHIFYDVTESRRTEEQLHLAIQSIMSDASWFSHEVIARLNHVRAGGSVETYEPIGLSSREREVLIRLALGLDNTRIAEELGLKTQTVRNYLSNIYDKLGVHSRGEAIIWARDHGMTTL